MTPSQTQYFNKMVTAWSAFAMEEIDLLEETGNGIEMPILEAFNNFGRLMSMASSVFYRQGLRADPLPNGSEDRLYYRAFFALLKVPGWTLSDPEVQTAADQLLALNILKVEED